MTEPQQAAIIIISIVFFFAFILVIQAIFIIKSEFKDLRTTLDKLDDKIREQDRINHEVKFHFIPLESKIRRLEK